MNGTGREHDFVDLLEPLDERPGPAARISSQRAAAMVTAALDRAQAPQPEEYRADAPRARGRRSAALVAAAVLVIGGGAIAAILHATSRDDSPPAPAVDTPRQVTPPADEPVIEPIIEPIDEPIDEPNPEAKRRPPRPAHPTAIRGDSEDLLAAANERRGARAWREAAGLYDRVRREHPDTTAAYVATVASAEIHLQHLGKARRALALYRDALRARPDGTLSAEARFGIAEAHRAIGDGDAERAALRELIAKHPDSLLRERAERRLDELAGDEE